MLKPPTLLLLLSYGIFFAAWDVQAATALSLSGLRADLHASVDKRHSDVVDQDDDRLSSSVTAGSSRFGLRSAAHSIAQSIRAFFQGSPFVHQTPSSVASLRGMGIASSHSWETTSSSSGPHWHNANLTGNQRLARHSSPVAILAATPSTNLPSFLLTASSALRFQHRLRDRLI